MRFPNVANLAASVVLAIAGVLAFQGPIASAQNVHLLVCPQEPESYAFISSPLSDTLVDTPTLKLEGSVSSISQVDVYIDDAYNNTVAIGLGETSFAKEISIEQGTHTVKIIAQDNCFQLTHEDSVVVTYHPKVVPGNGGDTNTTVSNTAGTTSAGPSVSQSGSADDDDQSLAADSSGPRLPMIIETVLDNLDIDRDRPGDVGIIDTFRPLLVLTGILTATVLPVLFDRGKLDGPLWYFWYRPLGRKRKKLKGYDRQRTRLIRGIGIALIIVPFIV